MRDRPRRAALACLFLALLVLTGCSNKAERLYKRAEIFFSQGEPYLAAVEYHRLSVEQPNSALADDALYKLAYLYREEFDDPTRAIQTYQVLANRYSDSPYADDALLWILEVQGRKLKDATGVRLTLATIRERFPDDERVLATAQLQLVRTLFAAAQYPAADQEAQALINRYPQQQRQCASALLTRARILEKLGKPGDQKAVKLYEQVVTRYPDTPGAVEAKRSIGWVYYGYRNVQMKEERLAKERAARVVSGVPPPPLVGALRLKPFACLSSLLAQRGVQVTPEELLVVSGAAFLFAYSPANPRATTSALQRGALTAAAEQYGFGANVWSAPSADSSFASLAQAIAQGHPVMVPQVSLGNWVIATGYRPAEERVYVIMPGQRQPLALSRAEFLSRWARSDAGHTACVTGPYFQLSLGQRIKAPSASVLLRDVARRAVSALNEDQVQGVAAGAQAWDTLAEQLSNLQGNEPPEQLQALRHWSSASLPAFLAERRAAAAFLGQSGNAAGGAAAEHAAQASAALGDMVRLGAELRRELASLLKPATGAEPPPEASWPEAAERVRQIRAADEKALAALAVLAR